MRAPDMEQIGDPRRKAELFVSSIGPTFAALPTPPVRLKINQYTCRDLAVRGQIAAFLAPSF
jgi:hypothetical protein